MLTLKGMPEGRFFLLPDVKGGKCIYIKKRAKGREALYRVVGAEAAKDGHILHVKRLHGLDIPHAAAKAALVPIESFFKTPPEVIYED